MEEVWPSSTSDEELAKVSRGEQTVSDLVGHFSRTVNCCHSQAVLDARTPDFSQTCLSDVLAPAKSLLKLATSGEEILNIKRGITSQKKQFFRQRASERFERAALRAPRDDKIKKSKAAEVFPMLIDGEPSFDPAAWKAEFERVFHELFVDPSNGSGVQAERLSRLRAEGKLEPHIVIPRFLLEEGLARKSQKGTQHLGRMVLLGPLWYLFPRRPADFCASCSSYVSMPAKGLVAP